jgi:hypothetical protein
MLYLEDVEGEIPNRTLHFMRLGAEGEPRRGRGDSLGLSWRDDEWSQQARHRDSVTEQDLWQTLNEEYWLIQVVRGCATAVGSCGRAKTYATSTPSQVGMSPGRSPSGMTGRT